MKTQLTRTLIVMVGLLVSITGYGQPFTEITKILASDAAASSQHGFTSDIHGDYAVVGSPLHGGSGAAYIYYRNQGGTDNWGEVIKLTAFDQAVDDRYGFNVSIHGTYVAIGSMWDDDDGSYSGSVYLYEKDQGGVNNWGLVKKITPSDGGAFKGFGLQVSLSATELIVGANESFMPSGGFFNPIGPGAAYIFSINQGGANNWGEVKKLTASDGSVGDQFAFVDIDGDIAVVGAWNKNSLNGGAYIYSRNSGGANNWGQIKILGPSVGGFAGYGTSVGVSGSNVLIGSYYESGGTGAAYVYGQNQGGANNWGLTKKINSPATVSSNEWFGVSVSINNDKALIGAHGTSTTFTNGECYVFEQNQGGANNWGQTQMLTASDAATYDYFGSSVSINGNQLVIGAYGNDDNGSESGSAYIFSNCASSPATSINTSSNPVCAGTSVTLSVVGGALGTGGSWEWYTGSCGGTSVGTGTSISVTPSTTTTYYVRAEAPCGNSVCTSVTVNVNTVSTAPTSITATSDCSTGNTTLTVNGGSLGTGGSWEWYTGSCGGTPAGSGSSISVNPPTTTTYFVRAEDACGNTTCQSVSVPNLPTSAPDATWTDPSTSGTVCEAGGSINLNALITGTTGGTWSGTGVTGSTFDPSGLTGSVTITYTVGPAPCTDMASHTFTVQPDVDPAWTSPGNICGNSGSINLNSLITGTTGGTWSGPGVSGNTFDPSAQSGNVTITYTVGTAPCEETQNHTFNVNPDVDPTWTNPSPVCVIAGTVDLSTLITGTTGGSFSGTGVTGSTFDPTGLAGQTTSITYTVGTAPCEEQSTLNVNVTNIVSAAWNAPTSICESDSPVDLNTLITGDTGGTWSGTGVSGSTFNPSGQSGSVTITYEVGAAGCLDSQASSVTILAAPGVPTVSVVNDTICEGDNTMINASGSGTGITYNVYDSATGGTLLGQTPLSVNPSSNTSYFVEAINANNCVNAGGRVQIDITVIAIPTADAGADQTICPGDVANLLASGGTNYNWDHGDMTAASTVSPTSSTYYYVTVSNWNCSERDSVLITILGPGSGLAVDDNTTTTTGTAVTFDVSANDLGDPNSVTIIQGPANGTASSLTGDITYNPASGFSGIDSVQYTICDQTCTAICDTATLYVTVQDDISIKVPSGITPNGDGINDYLVIHGIEQVDDPELMIYNRWGDLVFSANPYNNNWNGQSEKSLYGDKVVDGTYFYIFTYSKNNEPNKLNGYVEVKSK